MIASAVAYGRHGLMIELGVNCFDIRQAIVYECSRLRHPTFQRIFGRAEEDLFVASSNGTIGPLPIFEQSTSVQKSQG